ncbi:hypothetical protein [Magnetospirillum sp. UT-4]|uniref:hypothetical protein n=1 Tax=Magnetospirillum sp. UT-4 TaxID=2681467 RepID=UPI001381A120|nr:hypothetical protein [Magnetospirillum sp. UT-4]CAA7621958.1 conserved exported hypothetical protein [Magnetospirillum sp. UT-4]
MTKAQRSTLVSLVTAACLAWMAGIGWLMWTTLPESAVAHHSSSSVKDRMEAECQGTFKQRYQCKEEIIVESGRDTFWNLSSRFLLVIVPPIIATVWLSSFLGRHPVPLNPGHHQEAGGDWKQRAFKHTQTQSPEEAARDLHLDKTELPGARRGPGKAAHHTLDDIAPVDDWKSKAKAHTTRPRMPEDR